MLKAAPNDVLIRQAITPERRHCRPRPGRHLLINPGIRGDEIRCLANNVARRASPSRLLTHPDWDHVLWHADLGEAPRYGTARCAAYMQDLLSDGLDGPRRQGITTEIAEEIPLDLFGLVTRLPANGTDSLGWP